ncbi:MAG: acyl-CoA thioesterase [Myxococcota bacterium]
MNELVLPTHANALGNIFGGQVMAWIDVCAALAAMRHAGMQCVTASMDALDFILPIKVGHVVNLRAMVNFVGRTSLEVGVRVESGPPVASARDHVASAYLTFVALGADGRPAPVPPLVPESDEERLRWAEAEARRAQRLALASERKRLRAAHDAAHAAAHAAETSARDGGAH